MIKLADKLTLNSRRKASVRLLSIALIAALLWSSAGIVPTAQAEPVGPKFTWELYGDRQFVDIAYGNGVYVAISERQETVGFDTLTVSTVSYSNDMLAWTDVDLTSITTRPLSAVHYENGQFVLTSRQSNQQTQIQPPQPFIQRGRGALL